MNKTAGVQMSRTQKDAREQLGQQIAEYLTQQSESTLTFHRWMKRLEVASLGIIAAVFIMALYVSIRWATVPAIMIPIAWFVFAASASLVIVLIGLHAVILRAFPPIVLPGSSQNFITGRGAFWTGLGVIVVGLVVACFWGYFAYAVGTFNLVMLEPLVRILGTAVGAVIVIGILLSIAQKIVKFR